MSEFAKETRESPLRRQRVLSSRLTRSAFSEGDDKGLAEPASVLGGKAANALLTR